MVSGGLKLVVNGRGLLKARVLRSVCDMIASLYEEILLRVPSIWEVEFLRLGIMLWPHIMLPGYAYMDSSARWMIPLRVLRVMS